MQEKLQHLTYYKWLVFAVTAVGTFMATLDSSIVNVAMPIISSNLGTTLNTLQWVVTAYLLTTSSLLPVFGRAGDMFDRRGIYGIGFIIFTVGSALCAASVNIAMLIVSRVVQAIGASMLMANSPAVLTNVFPASQRGQALGMVGTMVALGSMTGPSLGGILVGMFGWRSIFYINLPIGIIGYILSQLILPRESNKPRESFDYAGAILFSSGMVCMLLLISNLNKWGFLSSFSILVFFMTVISFAVFIRKEVKIKYPMLNLALFKRWTFTAGNLAGMLSFMALFSNTFLLPFYLSTILKLDPKEIGFVMTAFPVAMAVTAPLSGYLSDRIGAAILTVSGMIIVMVALVCLSMVGEATALWVVFIIMAVSGVGNGMFQSPNNSAVMSTVHVSNHGVAGSMTALVRNMGMVIGTAISVAVFEHSFSKSLYNTGNNESTAFLAGYHSALIVGACFAGCSALLSIHRFKRNKK